MTTEYLVPNGDDISAGDWSTGTYADIDNGILGGTPDSNEVTSGNGEGLVLNLDLTDSAITDADTVTGVDIRVHAYSLGDPDDNILVDLLISGSPVGTQQETGHLTTTPTTYLMQHAGWDSDWTASELDGMQVRLTTEQGGMPEVVDIRVREVEVDITYTEAPDDVPTSQIWM